MIDPELAKMASEFGAAVQEWNKSYEEFAKSIGLTYSRLLLLDVIYTNPDACTQSYLCERAMLPKQTVNTIVTGFIEQGIVELRENPADRRSKHIAMTDYGRTYIDGIIPAIKRAECEAMGTIDPETREAMLRGIKQYAAVGRELLGLEK